MKPKHLATAPFTRDMAENLLKYFDRYEVDGVVVVEVTDHGLWLENPDGSRQFLGSTTPLPGSPKSSLN